MTYLDGKPQTVNEFLEPAEQILRDVFKSKAAGATGTLPIAYALFEARLQGYIDGAKAEREGSNAEG